MKRKKPGIGFLKDIHNEFENVNEHFAAAFIMTLMSEDKEIVLEMYYIFSEAMRCQNDDLDKWRELIIKRADLLEILRNQ